ncbi:MAG: hypothetical protein QM809_14005 [Gordonia sp. (in: high G+C Gram-positive bacteria)]
MNRTVVGVLGSGNIGEDVARLATNAGLPVVVANSKRPRVPRRPDRPAR